MNYNNHKKLEILDRYQSIVQQRLEVVHKLKELKKRKTLYKQSTKTLVKGRSVTHDTLKDQTEGSIDEEFKTLIHYESEADSHLVKSDNRSDFKLDISLQSARDSSLLLKLKEDYDKKMLKLEENRKIRLEDLKNLESRDLRWQDLSLHTAPSIPMKSYSIRSLTAPSPRENLTTMMMMQRQPQPSTWDDILSKSPHNNAKSTGTGSNSSPIDTPAGFIARGLQIAQRIQDIAPRNIDILHTRLQNIQEEKLWLESHPSAQSWEEMRERVGLVHAENGDTTDEEASLMNRFVESSNLKKNIRKQAWKKDTILRVLRRIIDGITDEVCAETASEIANGAYQFIVDLSHRLEEAIIRAIANPKGKIVYPSALSEQNNDDSRVGVTKRLLTGALCDLKATSRDLVERRNHHSIKRLNLNDDNDQILPYRSRPSDFRVARTQLIQYGRKSSTSMVMKAEMESLLGPPVVALNGESSEVLGSRLYDSHLQSALEELERSYWDEVRCDDILELFMAAFNNPIGGPLLIPDGYGKASVLRIHPLAYASSSQVVLGTATGNIIIWTVPWSGREPHLTALSKKAEKKTFTKIVDIKRSHLGVGLNNYQVFSLDDKGNVRIWTLSANIQTKLSTSTAVLSVLGLIRAEQLAKAKKIVHSKKIFPEKFQHKVPNILVCVAVIRSSDLNLPPSSLEFYTENRGDSDQNSSGNSVDLQQKYGSSSSESFVTSLAIHPSMTLLNRHSSVMLGTRGGNMFKYNTDYNTPKEQTTPILHTTNILQVEFAHPAYVPEGTLLTEAKSDKRGNTVLRELFQGHKAAIIFIDILYASTYEAKKSLDEKPIELIERVVEEEMHQDSDAEVREGLEKEEKGRIVPEDVIVTIDEDHIAATWSYSKANATQSNGCWFRPVRRVKLDLRWESIVPILDKSLQRIESPNLTQLKLWRRFTHKIASSGSGAAPRTEGQTTHAVVVSIYTRTNQSGPIQKTIECHTSSAIPRNSLNEVDASIQKGSDENLLKIDQSAGAEVNKFNKTMSMRRPINIWSEREVRTSLIETSLLSLTRFADGSGLLMALSFENKNVTENYSAQTLKIDDKSSPISLESLYPLRGGLLVTLSPDLKFEHPLVIVSLESSDEILDVSCGPVSAHTMSRSAFVLTKLRGCRIFSLRSGQELASIHASLPSFLPRFIATCPLQRIVAYTAADDSRLSVLILNHTNQGDENSSLIVPGVTDKSSDVRSKFNNISRMCVTAHIAKALHDGYNHLAVDTVNKEQMFTLSHEQKEDLAWMMSLVNVLVDMICDTSILDTDIETRTKMIRELLGSNSNLGVISPSSWPVSQHNGTSEPNYEPIEYLSLTTAEV